MPIVIPYGRLWIGIPIGAVFLIWGLWEAAYMISVHIFGRCSAAVVCGYDKDNMKSPGLIRPDFRFITEKGDSIRGTYFCGEFHRYYKDEEVIVKYLPKNPRRFIVVSDFAWVMYPSVLIGTGVLMILLGLK